MKNLNKKIHITLKKSLIGISKNHKACVKGIGLKKINDSSTIIYSLENLGMINKVSYMLNIVIVKEKQNET